MWLDITILMVFIMAQFIITNNGIDKTRDDLQKIKDKLNIKDEE